MKKFFKKVWAQGFCVSQIYNGFTICPFWDIFKKRLKRDFLKPHVSSPISVKSCTRWLPFAKQIVALTIAILPMDKLLLPMGKQLFLFDRFPRGNFHGYVKKNKSITHDSSRGTFYWARKTQKRPNQSRESEMY